jgi:hypothetical protein
MSAGTIKSINSAGTTMTIAAPAHAAGTVDVTVSTAGGTSVTTNGFTYIAAPTITALNVSTGSASGGTSVLITGTGFTGTTAVKFGTLPAASYTVVSSTQITAVSPAHGAGAVDISVTNAAGTSVTADADAFMFT